MTELVSAKVQVPFMGLLFFDERHADLFFGRDDQVHELLAKLERSRFVAVLGSSGSGKSSLVRAGLIPALQSGICSTAGLWRVVKTQPGGAPLRLLADALEAAFRASGLELTLRRGPLGLIQAATQAGLGPRERLLVLVDQFEEIFRFQRDASPAARDEAVTYVRLLLEAVASSRSSIYVVLTMRSEYLGNCSDFRDLPERINHGLYLVPKMTRDQMEEAIRGPLALVATQITDRLVQRLLNDVGDVMDQLPVLQHALLRTWLRWKGGDRPGEPLDIDYYERAGGLREGLNRHANEIFEGLGDREKKIAEVLFRCLTEKDPRNRDIRRPTELSVIAPVAGATADQVRIVAEVFRAEGTAFLMPPPSVALEENRKLDITHESLIRQWSRLSGDAENKGWVQDEAELRDRFRELLMRARRRKTDDDLLFGGDLETALQWRAAGVGPVWAQRYDPDPQGFVLVQKYISDSVARRGNLLRLEGEQRAREEELARANRNRKIYGGVSAILVVLLGFALWSFYRAEVQRRIAEDQGRIAAQQRDRATREEAEAKRLAAFARAARDDAEAQKKKADGLRHEAERLHELATARELASHSDGMKGDLGRAELRALLALESVRRAPLEAGMRALADSLSVLAAPVLSGKLIDDREGLAVAFDAGLQQVASVSGRNLKIARFSDLQMLRQIRLPLPPHDLAWHNGKLYFFSEITDGGNTSVYSVDPGSGEVERIKDLTKVAGIVLSEGGGFLAVNTAEGPAQVLQLPGLTAVPAFADSRSISAIAAGAAFVVRERPPSRAIETKELVGRNGVIQRLRSAQSCWFDRLGSLAACEDNQNRIAIFDSGGVKAAELPLPQNSAFAGVDSARVAAVSEDGAVSVIDWRTGKPLGIWVHSSEVLTVVFAADGVSATSIGEDGSLRRVRLNIHRPAESLSDNEARLISLDSSGRWLSLGQTNRPRLIEFASGKPFRNDRKAGGVTSPDGNWVAVIEGDSVQIYEASGESVKSVALVERPSGPLSLAVSTGARRIATATRSGIHVYDLRSPEALRTPVRIDAERASRPVFSGDGKYLTFRGYGSGVSLTVIDCDAGRTVFRLPVSLTAVIPYFSPDGAVLAVREYGTFRSEDGEGTETKGSSVMRGRPGLRFFSVQSWKEIWNVPSGTLVARVPAFSADGRYIAVPGAREQVRVMDVKAMRELPPLKVSGVVTRLAFSDSGEYLAAGDQKGVGVYLLRSGVPTGSAQVPEDAKIAALKFIDGEQLRLAIVSATGLEFRNQPWSVVALKAMGCVAISRNLSREEWKRYLPDDPSYRRTCADKPALSAEDDSP